MLIGGLRREFPAVTFSDRLSWGEITSLGIGRAKPVIAEPADAASVAALVQWARRSDIPVMILGGGTNLVGADRDRSLLVIRLRGKYFGGWQVIGGGRVVAGAALRLKQAAELAASVGLGGLAPLCGIPGQLGGAVRMNAGANGCEIGSLVRRISGIDASGEPFELAGDAIAWSYRASSIPEGAAVLTVELELPAGEAEAERAAIAAEVAARGRREPGGRSAGCIFRNVGAEESAGLLIDRAGLKNLRIGDAMVSGAHANYLVNAGAATAEDFARLAGEVRDAVWRNDHFSLDYEVCFADPKIEALARSRGDAPPVALFLGGSSSEREVSLRSGAAIQAALANAGWPVRVHDITECRLPEWLTPEFLVYLGLHGGFGEDGTLQKLLEEAGIEFVGSGSAASALVMDKIATKKLAGKIGIPTAPWAEITAGMPAELPAGLKFPVVLKAPCEGSTIGIATAAGAAEFAEALAKLRRMSGVILVEEFVTGAEITVPVIGGAAFPVVEIHSPHGFYDYDAKYVYNQGRTEYFCPPEHVSEESQRLAQRYSEELFRAAGCRDLARIDFIVDAAGTPVLLEGNTLPGCTATSLVPKSARAAGISFERLCARLASMALARRGDATP